YRPEKSTANKSAVPAARPARQCYPKRNHAAEALTSPCLIQNCLTQKRLTQKCLTQKRPIPTCPIPRHLTLTRPTRPLRIPRQRTRRPSPLKTFFPSMNKVIPARGNQALRAARER